MERTLFLFAVSCLLICQLGQKVFAAVMERPSVVLGSGTVSCGFVPLAGITLTAVCEDGVNPPVTISSPATQSDGFFTFDHYTDEAEKYKLNTATARCRLTSVQPAAMTKKMNCGGQEVEGTCSISLGTMPLGADMVVDYTSTGSSTSRGRGCTPKVDPQMRAAERAVFDTCSKHNQEVVVTTTQKIYIVPELTVASGVERIKSSADALKRAECSEACKKYPGCVKYSYNCHACALYTVADAISTVPIPGATVQGYEVTEGNFVCDTYIGSCP